MPFEEILLDPRVVARRKLMAGWGANDAPYVTQATVKNRIECCPYYLVWMRMVQSVYGLGGCGQICEEWQSFLTFKAWMQPQDWGEGKRLDVSLLGIGDRYHSPETCVFVTRTVANVVPSLAKHTGDLPVGVSCPQEGRYRATCGGNHLGLYQNAHAAHLAWCKAKAEAVYALAVQQTNMRVQAALVHVAEDLAGRV